MASIAILDPGISAIKLPKPTETPIPMSLPLISPQKVDSLTAFPRKLESELCWTTETFFNGPQDYIVHLTVDELRSIEAAVVSFKALGLKDIAFICPENFPLPAELVQKLRELSATIHHGRGFAVLRGLTPGGRTDEDNVIAFCGVASYIGRNRSTNDNGIAMAHLRDAIRDPKPQGREHIELHPSKMMVPLVRSLLVFEEEKFHADRKFADVLALYVKSHGAAGGQQFLASFWTIYNEMMRSCPEALRTLAEAFPWPGVVNGVPETTYTPVIFQQDGRVLCQLVYRIFEQTSILSPEQWRALNVLETIANKNAIQLEAVPGDIQLVNNLAVLHARRAWVDRPGHERHIYRLGLQDPENAWTKPTEYAMVFDDHMGVPVEEQMIPITDFDPYGLTSLNGNDGHG